MHRRLPVLAVLASAWMLGACVVEPANPYPPPPPLQSEAVPQPPVGQVWEPGHWVWNGSTYVWVRGHYILATAGGAHWVHGHWRWSNAQDQWVWVPGHWT
jgi:hypothetical protein